MFGIRLRYTTMANEKGFMMVSEPFLEGESTQDNIVMNMEFEYNPPDIRKLTKEKLTKEMVRILRVKVDEPKMEEKEKEYWDGVTDREEEEDDNAGDWVTQN